MSAAKRLRPFMAGEWRSLTGAAAMTVLLVAADLAKPFPIKIVIDNLLTGRDAPFTLDRSDYRLLAAVAVLLIAISLLEAAGNYFSDLWLQSAGERIAHRLRIALYDHLQRLSLRFHLQREKGDLVTRVTQDVNSIGELFASSIGQLAQSALLLLGMVVVTGLLDPVLAVAMCATLPLLGWVSFTYRRRVKASSRLQRAEEGVIASRATEALSAMSVIKAFGSEDLERERVVSPSEQRMSFGIQVARLQARFDGLVGVLLAIGTALVVVIGAMRVASGALSIGDLVVFTAYVRRANGPMKTIAREWTKVARAMARGERVAEIMEEDDLLEDRPGAYGHGRLSGTIELRDVTFAYDDRRPVLDGVSLTIAPGERVALIGPSGAGKSTLCSLIARFHDPTGGAVLLDGRDARDCELSWLRSQVGVLLQDTVLFSGTVDDNIGYATEATANEIGEAARLAAADAFIESLPDGYATELGPQGIGLSGGQRQRLGIARTLLRDPAVLILDEPTTGLDAESEAQVMEGLGELMRDRTTVMITHSLELARRADRLLVVADGGIVADGPPGELLADGGPYRRILEERRRRSSRRVAALRGDRGLPQLPRLIDVDDMRVVLQRSLGDHGTIDALDIERVTYKPRDKAHVHYRTTVDGERRDAVVLADVEVDLSRRIASPDYREAADLVARRTAGLEPVSYDAELDAMISWLPFDIALPALIQPPARLARRLQWAGLDVAPDAPRPYVLGYRPRSRAVLRVDGHVVKAYGRRHNFERAVAGLCRASEVGGNPLELALSDLRVTVEAAVDGDACRDPLAVASEAGEVLRRLHAAEAGDAPLRSPHDLLAAAEERAQLAATLRPDLRRLTDELIGRLAASVPATDRVVLSHGDFRAGRLLATRDGLTLIDLDGLCLADPALDLASYVVDARHATGETDLPVAAVLEPLLEGYGATPEALSWYLATTTLTHAVRPFRRQDPHWPELVEHKVRTAMEALNP